MRRWRARAAPSRSKHYRVLPLSRRGWVAGSDSLVGSLLTETGLFNAAGDLGFAFGGFASLEAIVEPEAGSSRWCRRPATTREDDGRAFLLHPALERFYPPEKRIVIPERLTECGGVMLADALDAAGGGGEAGGRSEFVALQGCGIAKRARHRERDPSMTAWARRKRGCPRDGRSHPVSTGPPAFFQASMPPAICAVLASPASLAAATAMAERSPKAQKNTMRRPVAAATSRSMPPGCRLSPIAGVGRVQRARQRAVLGAFAVFAQIDQQDVGPAEAVDRLAGGEREALLGKIVLMQADMHVGGHRDIHHLRIRQLQIGHQLDIFVDRAHLQPRIVSASPRRWWRRCRPCSRGRGIPWFRPAVSAAG